MNTNNNEKQYHTCTKCGNEFTGICRTCIIADGYFD